MNITLEDVNYIAKLAKLRFSEEEAMKMMQEFEGILDHFHSIDKLDLEDVNLNIFAEDKKSVIRSDIKTTFDDKQKLFSNVKSMRDTYIEVPKIIE